MVSTILLYSTEFNTVQRSRSAARSTPRARFTAVKWTKKTPGSQGVGRSFFQTSALAERLDDQGANREECHADCDCRNGRDRDLLLPPIGGGAGCVRQRRHDTLLDVHRRDPAAEHLALGVYAGPKLHLRFALSLTCAHFVHLTVKPVVQ